MNTILYSTDGGKVKQDAQLEHGAVWLEKNRWLIHLTKTPTASIFTLK